MKTKSSTQNTQARKIDALAQQLLKIENELNSNIPATLWISDLHGEGDRFKSILRGRFGMLFQTCREALPKTVSTSKIQYLAKTIRKSRFLPDKQIVMDPQDVIFCLVQILKYKLANIRSPIKDLLLPEFRNTIQRLLTDLPVPNAIFEEEILSKRLIAHLSYTIRKVLLDHILVLGDVFDRGSQPDKILRILSSPAYEPMVDYVFGNHDILWMGAAAGNRSLIAEAMRISCRYDNFDLLDRLHFDSSKLAAFAERTYPPSTIPGTFKAKTNHGLSMEKALVVIQFKLEEETIAKHPEYKMTSRCWMKRLATILKSGDTKELNDNNFPTIDFENPGQLSLEEQEIITDLEQQFTQNTKLKRLLGYLFTKGKTYHVHNNSLNIHALVPATKDGNFETFLDHSGKDLLDFIDATIKRTGERYLDNTPQAPEDCDLFFYLWCGPKSPFFGKHAMKTFERYFLVNKERHYERTLHWKSNLKTKAFKEKLKTEFDVNRVVFGHTPVNYSKGDKMASEDGVAINIDGGFAAAYYNRGHALVQTPHQLYGIILPTPEEMKEATKNLDSAPLNIELIDEFQKPMKVKDTKEGQHLKIKSKAIIRAIRDLAPDAES